MFQWVENKRVIKWHPKRLFTYDTVAVLIPLQELYALLRDLYLPFLIQPSRRHLERFLTHAKEGIDVLGIGLVMVRQAAFVLL